MTQTCFSTPKSVQIVINCESFVSHPSVVVYSEAITGWNPSYDRNLKLPVSTDSFNLFFNYIFRYSLLRLNR